LHFQAYLIAFYCSLLIDVFINGVLVKLIIIKMKSTKVNSKADDGDYDYRVDPKRKKYKKIKV
jgi:hypothetical protein